MKEWTFVCHVIPLETQLSAADSLIDSMMLVEKDDDGNEKDIFKVHKIPNPAFQRHFQVLLFSLYWRDTTLLLLFLFWVETCKVQLSNIMKKTDKLWSVRWELYQLGAADIFNHDFCLNSTFLPVSASSGSQARHPSSPDGAMAEGCTWASWCHQWTLPNFTRGGEEKVSAHRSGEEKEAEDKCSGFWQRVGLSQYTGRSLNVTNRAVTHVVKSKILDCRKAFGI